MFINVNLFGLYIHNTILLQQQIEFIVIMKELTIEEKAARYDEAIEKAKECHTDGLSLHQPVKDVLEHIFHELKESEDERVRKSLIDMLKNDEKCYLKEIAWLEKQGEKQPAGKVEPKFKVDDWVIDKQGIVHQIANVIKNITNHTYSYDVVGGGFNFNDNTEGVRLWTIQDAKDGDLLADNYGIYIFDRFDEYDERCYFCRGAYQYSQKEYENEHMLCSVEVHPATKEQRDLLFQKMKEAGYVWDAEKKELKKIENETEISFGANDSELQEATYYIPKGFHAEIDNNKVVIKKGEKPTAWSEEDEKMLDIILNDINYAQKNFSNSKLIPYGRKVDWLKAFKDRYAWKPSEEQIDALESVVSSLQSTALESLCKDLMKLRRNSYESK